MVKQTIHIDRPHGFIPDLLEVNEQLDKMFGIRIYISIDTNDPNRYTWKGCGIYFDPELVADPNSRLWTAVTKTK